MEPVAGALAGGDDSFWCDDPDASDLPEPYRTIDEQLWSIFDQAWEQIERRAEDRLTKLDISLNSTPETISGADGAAVLATTPGKFVYVALSSGELVTIDSTGALSMPVRFATPPAAAGCGALGDDDAYAPTSLSVSTHTSRTDRPKLTVIVDSQGQMHLTMLQPKLKLLVSGDANFVPLPAAGEDGEAEAEAEAPAALVASALMSNDSKYLAVATGGDVVLYNLDGVPWFGEVGEDGQAKLAEGERVVPPCIGTIKRPELPAPPAVLGNNYVDAIKGITLGTGAGAGAEGEGEGESEAGAGGDDAAADAGPDAAEARPWTPAIHTHGLNKGAWVSAVWTNHHQWVASPIEQEGAEAARMTVSTRAAISASCSNGGGLLAVGTADGVVTVWDLEKGAPCTTTLTGSKPAAMQFSPGGVLVVGGADGACAVLDPVAGTKRLVDLTRLDNALNDCAGVDLAKGPAVCALAVGADLVVAEQANGRLVAFDLRTSALLKLLSLPAPFTRTPGSALLDNSGTGLYCRGTSRTAGSFEDTSSVFKFDVTDCATAAAAAPDAKATPASALGVPLSAQEIVSAYKADLLKRKS